MGDMQETLIDIIVPTFNREKDLGKFIQEIQQQNYSNFKVYIMDDYGDEPIESIVPKESRFEYIRMPKNMGQASARNTAIEAGEGEIIVSLDDDAWFQKADALSNTIAYFKEHTKLGCLMYDIEEPKKKLLSEINNINEGDEIGFHITCGCAYRREALEAIGGFSDIFHSGAEVSDVTFKLIRSGYKLFFSKEISVYHNYQPGIRSKFWYRQLRANTTRNDLLLVVMYYPMLYVLPYFFGKYLSHILFSLRSSRQRIDGTLATLGALFGAIPHFYLALKRRNALSIGEFSDWKKKRI